MLPAAGGYCLSLAFVVVLVLSVGNGLYRGVQAGLDWVQSDGFYAFPLRVICFSSLLLLPLLLPHCNPLTHTLIQFGRTIGQSVSHTLAHYTGFTTQRMRARHMKTYDIRHDMKSITTATDDAANAALDLAWEFGNGTTAIRESVLGLGSWVGELELERELSTTDGDYYCAFRSWCMLLVLPFC